MFFDPLYFLFVAPGFILGLWAQYKVKSRFKHFSQVANATGLSGAEVAQRILDIHGIRDVGIERVQGTLTDHYDPRDKMLRLSPDVYAGRSIAAAGVAAHEVGHAIQHFEAYRWLGMRSAMVPALQFAAPLSTWTLLGGLVLSSMGVALGTPVFLLGVVLFSVVVLFQLVTLPVEFDASRRALVDVQKYGLIGGEQGGAKKVLDAAALTYVAAAVSSIGTLLYYLYRSGLIGGRD